MTDPRYTAESYSVSLEKGLETGWCVSEGDDTICDFPVGQLTESEAREFAERVAKLLNEKR